LAVEVAAHLRDGPFDQVNNMIEKMIFHLMDEQKKEDEHKHWCDQELEKTNTAKENKEDAIDELKTKIDAATAKVAELTQDIAEANKMISDIKAFKAEATEIRKVGKHENKLALKDSQDAQNSVSNAIAVLTDFYKESGMIEKEDYEFMQAQKGVELPENPETWDSSYTGVADPKKAETGIITILEETLEKFAQMEADTKAQEAQDQEDYDQAMSAHDIEKAERTTEVEMKTAESKRLNDKIAQMSSTLKTTESELEATNQYLKDLEPACVTGDSSYEDRKAARAKEIDALKKAESTLADAFKEKKGDFLQVRKSA